MDGRKSYPGTILGPRGCAGYNLRGRCQESVGKTLDVEDVVAKCDYMVVRAGAKVRYVMLWNIQRNICKIRDISCVGVVVYSRYIVHKYGPFFLSKLQGV